MQPSQVMVPLTDAEPSLLPLHASEERLIRHMREMGHGELDIKVADGYPVLIKRKETNIRLV